MGQGAYLRIINRSTHRVTIEVQESVRVDEQGMDQIQGDLPVGAQLPVEGVEIFGGKYEYIEGDPRRRFHKDGHFELVAQLDDGQHDKVKLFCDHDDWWAKACNDDEDEASTPVVVMSADVEEEEPDKFRIDIKVHDYIPTESWMGSMADTIRDKPLCQVAMPGTHDSATYDFDEELGAAPDSSLTTTIQDNLQFGRGIIRKLGTAINTGILKRVYKRLCQCQELTVAEQLREGIRYLDLRIASYGEDQFYTCHGVYCINMETILDEVVQFLDAHPREIVLLDMNHFHEMTDQHHEKFCALVLEKLGDKVANQRGSHHLHPGDPVKKYWSKGAQAVVIYHHWESHKASHGKLWYRGCIESKWPESHDTEVLRSKLQTTIQERPDHKFFVLQGILTPDAELIKDEILESRGNLSIRTIAKRASQKVTNWVEDDWNDAIHNIVIVDFFNDCSMVTSVINLNKKPK